MDDEHLNAANDRIQIMYDLELYIYHSKLNGNRKFAFERLLRFGFRRGIPGHWSLVQSTNASLVNQSVSVHHKIMQSSLNLRISNKRTHDTN